MSLRFFVSFKFDSAKLLLTLFKVGKDACLYILGKISFLNYLVYQVYLKYHKSEYKVIFYVNSMTLFAHNGKV